jgi:hypothetical protein
MAARRVGVMVVMMAVLLAVMLVVKGLMPPT